MEEDYIEDIASLQAWFDEHESCYIKPYIEVNFRTESLNYQYRYMKEHLFFTKKIIQNEMMSNGEKQQKLLNLFSYGKSKICGIFGKRGGGKTGDAAWLIDELHKQNMHKNIFWIKEPQEEDNFQFPEWLHIMPEIEEISNNSIAIIDETSIKYNARNFWKDDNKDFISRLVILRHKNTSVVVISQHPMMIDKNIRRLLDIVIYKEGATLSSPEEKEDDDKVLVRRRLRPQSPEETLIEFDSFFLKFTHELPGWWSNYVSKAFKNYNPERKSKNAFAQKRREEFERQKEMEAFKLEKMKELDLRPKEKIEVKARQPGKENQEDDLYGN